MKETRRKLYENLGLGNCFQRPWKTLSLVINIRNTLKFFLMNDFSRQLRFFSLLLVLRFIMGRVRINTFCGNLRPANAPLAILFHVAIMFSYAVLFTLMNSAELLLFLAICLGFSEGSEGRNLETYYWELHIF